MNKKVKNFSSIDLAKFVMAFFVVAIHTKPLANCNIQIINDMYNSIVKCAVPFFFIACGFLISQKSDDLSSQSEVQVVLSKHLLKITKMYLLWTVIYMPLAIYDFCIREKPFISSVLSYLHGMIIIGENYNSWMLWYLLSTIYALIFIAVLIKRMKLAHIAIFGGSLFFVGFAINALVDYGGQLTGVALIAKKIFSAVKLDGRIFTGFLYIPLGMLLGKKKISVFSGIILVLFGYICNIFFDGIVGECMIIVTSVGIFSLVSNIKLRNSSVYLTLRNASTGIYFIHMYVWTIYYMCFYQGNRTFGLDCFIFTAVVSLILSLLYLWASDWKKKNRQVESSQSNKLA